VRSGLLIGLVACYAHLVGEGRYDVGALCLIVRVLGSGRREPVSCGSTAGPRD
jgi:hypothetical protein